MRIQEINLELFQLQILKFNNCNFYHFKKIIESVVFSMKNPRVSIHIERVNSQLKSVQRIEMEYNRILYSFKIEWEFASRLNSLFTKTGWLWLLLWVNFAFNSFYFYKVQTESKLWIEAIYFYRLIFPA